MDSIYQGPNDSISVTPLSSSPGEVWVATSAFNAAGPSGSSYNGGYSSVVTSAWAGSPDPPFLAGWPRRTKELASALELEIHP